MSFEPFARCRLIQAGPDSIRVCRSIRAGPFARLTHPPSKPSIHSQPASLSPLERANQRQHQPISDAGSIQRESARGRGHPSCLEGVGRAGSPRRWMQMGTRVAAQMAEDVCVASHVHSRGRGGDGMWIGTARRQRRPSSSRESQGRTSPSSYLPKFGVASTLRVAWRPLPVRALGLRCRRVGFLPAAPRVSVDSKLWPSTLLLFTLCFTARASVLLVTWGVPLGRHVSPGGQALRGCWSREPPRDRLGSSGRRRACMLSQL